MSGKSDKEQQAKDALVVQAARNSQISKSTNPINKPPPPSGPSNSNKPKPSLLSMGFAKVQGSDNESDDNKSSPKMATRIAAVVSVSETNF